MSNTALIVIDMLNEYLLPEGLVYCEKCRGIITNTAKTIDAARDKGVTICYVNTSLESDKDIMVKKWGLHAVKGSKGARVVDELAPKEADLVVEKKLYDGFFQTKLHEALQDNKISNVVITGIHTHVCVLFTAVGAFEHGYNVTTLEDCITTGYLPNHESRLRFFKTHVGELMDSQDWLQSL